MLLGDPALDISARSPAIADTFDVAVGTHDIGSPSPPYLRSGATFMPVTVRNTWKTDALNVDVELWDGQPDSTGSTLLSSATLDTVPAYGKATANFTVSGFDGNVELFARLDPDNNLVERSEANNIASRSFLALPYKGTFPAYIETGARAIVVSDLRSDAGKEFLVTGPSDGVLKVRCFSAADTVSKWSFSADSSFYVYNNPTVGHIFKSAGNYVALEYGHPLKLRLINGQSGAVVKTRLSNDRATFLSGGVVSWVISDYGADDAAMELTALLYRDHTGVDTLLLSAFAPNSSTLASAIVDVGFNLSSPATLAVGDIDKNGSKEVVVSCRYAATGNELQVFTYSGGFSPLWQANISNGSGFYVPSLVLFDRDNDGLLEILCNGSTGSSFIRLYSSVGALLWGDLAVTDPHTFTAGDIDGDGDAEVVVADHQRLRIVSASTGSVLDAKTMLGDPASVPYLVDIDGDGKLNVVVLYEESPDAYLYPRRYSTRLYMLDETLDQIHSTYTFQTTSKSNVYVPTIADCAPVIDDIDGDGAHEMVYVSRDGYIHVFALGNAAGEATWPQRFANELLTGLNEQPIIGTYSKPISLYQRTRMLGSVTLDSTLAPSFYVGHGTRVRVDTSMVTPFRLRAFGSVRIKGSSSAPVVFRTSVASSGRATWGGLFVNDRFATANQPDTISRLVLTDASVGVTTRSPALVKGSTISNVFDVAIDAADTLELRDCTLNHSQGGGVTLNTLSASLQHCFIDDVSGTGASVSPGSSATIDSTTIHGCDIGISAYASSTLLTSSTVHDCLTYGSVFKDGNLRVLGTSFQGNDVGLFAATDTSSGTGGTVRACSFTYNNSGIEIDDTGDSTMVIDQCTLESNTTSGIYVEDYGAVSITDNDITNSSFGIISYHSSPRIHWHNAIENNGNGIKADGDSYAAIESCLVANNNFGVTVVGGTPDIGTVSGGSSTGYNILRPNDTYNVRNYTGGTVSAQHNYWPQKATPPLICHPKASKIYGFVDTTAALCSEPALTAPGPWAQPRIAPSLPKRFGLGQNYPNPFNPQTTVTFDVPHTEFVRIAVYDVTGRLVDVLVNEIKQPGFYEAIWEGRDRRGQQVATGVYFLHMAAGNFVQTRKMVLLK